MAKKKTSRRKNRHQTEYGSFAERSCAVNFMLRAVDSCFAEFSRHAFAQRNFAFRLADRRGAEAGAIPAGVDTAFTERSRSHRAEKQSGDFRSAAQRTGFRTGDAGSALESVAA